MSNFWEADPVVAPAKGGGNFWDNDPVVAPAPDIGENRMSTIAALRGIPIAGAYVDKGVAALNAAAQPVTETGLSHAPTFGQRMAENEAKIKASTDAYEASHPIGTTVGKMALGTAAMIPAMEAAPAAFGLTGTLPQMVVRGAASQGALGAADAAVRGENPVTEGVIGGVTGAAAPLAARAVGAIARWVRDYRNPPPVVPQHVENVAGVDVPLSTGQATGHPQTQAEEEIMRRGGRGQSAEEIARQADAAAQQAVSEASGNIGKSLDPTGTSPTTAPQDAGQAVQTELAQQEQAKQAADAAKALQVGAEGQNLARGLGGGAAPASPLDAAEGVGAGVVAKRDAAVAATQAAYKARDAVPGTFDPSVPKGLAEDIRTRLNTGENPIWVDPTNELTANKALKLIDQTVGKDSGLFANSAAPKPVDAGPALAATRAEDETTAALRAKFGNEVADAYAKQNIKAPPAEQPLSLIQFIASKGGLKPNPELDAIGLAHGHRAQIPGQPGFFGVVRKNGGDLDRMREAAEEAGYLRGANGATSTPADFLDAIDAELRGQKKYPEGFEGFKTKLEDNRNTAREQAEHDQINHGFERDLEDAGHGELGPEVKQRAVSLMRDEGMHPDEAVDHAMRQLDQEDAAAAGHSDSSFPGDRVPAGAPDRPVDLKTMDEARKRLVTMYGDAKSAAIRSGDKSDMRAMAKILHEFDNSIGDALESGKFSGDAKTAKALQDAARKSHAEYRQTFSSRGPGDEVGRAVEKILGRYTDSAATPDEIAAMSYGSKSEPGGGKAIKVALRLKQILGENSPEWAQYKAGLYSHIAETGSGETARTPAQIADRIDRFLSGSKGNGLAKVAYSSKERADLAAHANRLRGIEPKAAPSNDLEKAVARIAGTDGHLPASPGEVADLLYSRSGKGDKGISIRLGSYLKKNLSPESWTAVRQGMWEKLTNAGEGKIEYGPQALAQRLHEFLNESGRGLSQVLFSKSERAEMLKLASIYKRMTPLKGTTNPSGTAPMLAKIAHKASSNILSLIGFGAHGLTGAVIGHGLQKGLGVVKDGRAGKEANSDCSSVRRLALQSE